MTCEETIARIHARGRFSGKPGLHRIQALMDALGNPQDELKFVHVAGTNGKGSTSTMIASILQESGYRVGLYTSPYLVKFHERIAINGELISDEALIRLSAKTEQAADGLSLPVGEHIGEFEFVTAVAFQYFLEQNCDIVVLETGLGGAFDATNVIKAPEAAVITPISYDHMGVLGNTLEEIADAKAGIIKPGCIVVSARGQAPAVEAVLRKACPALLIADDFKAQNIGVMPQTFTVDNVVYAITLRGLYQMQNACTALKVVKVLTSLGWKIEENAILSGLKKAKISARMDCISESPRVIIDGGHNEDGVRVTVQSLVNSECKGYKLVVGMVADKAVETCVRQFASVAKEMFVTQPKSERALAAAELAQIAKKYCTQVSCYEELSDAIDVALSSANADDCIVICGSLYLAGEAKEYFAKRQN